MSWSVSAVGTPDEVAKRLEEYGGSLTGQSKVEFDDALPHLVGLVRQNFVTEESGQQVRRLSLSAYGHGSANDRGQLYRQCSLTLTDAPPEGG